MKYIAASNGELPVRPTALAPYFNPPLNPAILQRYEMRAKGPAKEYGPLDILVAEKPNALLEATEPVMEIAFKRAAERDATLPARSIKSLASLDPTLEIASREAEQAYRRDHHGENPKGIDQIRAYFKNPEDAEKVFRYYTNHDPEAKR